MKLPPSALAILLSASSSSAFSPSLHSQRTIALRPLFIGSNTPEPPREEIPDDDDDLGIRSSAEVGLGPRKPLPPDPEDEEESLYGVFGDDEERLLKSMGVSSLAEVDPFSTDVFIKPRPGKYGWKPIELTKEYQHAKDKTTVQTMSDNEREENLKLHKQLYEDSINLKRVGDRDAAEEARLESDRKRAADPWFGLNDRLEEAVKSDDIQEVDYLTDMIKKIGGPPPSLKDKVNEDGYVPGSAIFSLALTNERLKKLIKDARKEGRSEYQRQESVKWELGKIEDKKMDTKDEEVTWVQQMASERYMNRIQYLGEKGGNRNVKQIEKNKENMDKERKRLLEKWQSIGMNETPEDYYSDWEGRKEKLDAGLSDFAKEARRLDSFYEEDEEMEFDDNGLPVFDDDYWDDQRPKGAADKAREAARKAEAGGRPRLPGDEDVILGELDEDTEINEASYATTGPLTVEVSSTYNAENSDPPLRKHCFQYTVRITNNSLTDTVQLLSRRFEIQTVGSAMKDVVQGEGVTGRQPILKPGEVFEYTSTAPLSVRPLGTTIIAARMNGEYRYCTLEQGQETANEKQINNGQGEAGAELATFHFVFPEDQRVKQWKPEDDDDEDDEEEDDDEDDQTIAMASSRPGSSSPPAKSATDVAPVSVTPSTPATSLPGEPDMTSGNISVTPNDSSDTVTSDVRVVVTSTYRPERSDAKLDKHCFAYNVRISNESKENQSIQLVSRRFEIQTVGSQTKDVVQGPGVTGRQPVLKPGENFEYTSTAPLSVRPMLDKTQVVARMSGEYNFVQLADDGVTPLSSTPLKAELGAFHFILPDE